KAATWFEAQQSLKAWEGNLSTATSLDERQASIARSGLQDIRETYNGLMGEQTFGYDHFGRETSVPISLAIKRFVDEEVLEGRIGDDFDKQFRQQVADIEARITELESSDSDGAAK